MIGIVKSGALLLLEYHPDSGTQWIYDAFSREEPIFIRKTYIFEEVDLHSEHDGDEFGFEEDSVVFKIGVLEGDYYKINSEILSIDVNLYFHRDIKITDNMFTAYRNISIFRKINKLVKEDIYIGFDGATLPFSEFERLINSFPNSNELNKYANARISSILRDYFDNAVDSVYSYENYMNNRYNNRVESNLLGIFARQEYEKYNYVLHKLKDMLDNEINYSEKQWQRLILEIIQLIYPKYIRVFEEVNIRDVYKQKNKRLDYMLVDSNGNIDIVEIKKPFSQSIVSQNKYRDNHIPLRELSGSVMQIEKYIFYLNKWGKQGEELLTTKYRTALPDNFSIKIVNPSGIIIMGRENSLSKEQLEDYEVIKRKYKNVIDIITYDELISRLEHIIYKFTPQ